MYWLNYFKLFWSFDQINLVLGVVNVPLETMRLAQSFRRISRGFAVSHLNCYVRLKSLN